ncbi:MAG: ATP-binding cassette domain-containing protein [Gammaproteobacteria bacterium]|nr:ATP-binding cassette domain-containing protein [Gammaproteobacteria bacterium]
MSLLTLDDVSLTIGDLPILRHAELTLEPNERVCLIGRNGAGKSTLFRIITGEQAIDEGEIRYRQNLRVSELKQTLPDELDLSVHEFVVQGLSHLKQLIDEYQALSATELDKQGMHDLEELQRRIDAEGGWSLDKRVETVLSEMDLPADKQLGELSGGWRRRVALARALVSNPELLLLDEPTNHLDLATIRWLEDRIRSFPGSVLFITHDRAFLQSLATRIVELDRARLTSWPGDYKNFQRRKAESLHAEKIDQKQFEKELAQEEAWIRQGIKARRTRNEGRVRNLESMREEAAERDQFKPQQKARISIEEGDLSGRKVIEMHNVGKRFGDVDEKPLIDSLNLKIMRGDRIGLVGNNGVGKSTLLRIMLDEMAPDTGTVKLGTNLQVGYFDQLRRNLDPDRTIAEIVGNGKDYIRINGKERHVIGYLRGFLFSAKRAMTKVGALSGGECNRIILAKLFTQPTNLLVLDEPTNDLDVETLEVLEQRLKEYTGTLIVVSHDREFLDNVVDRILVFEEGGEIVSYAGGWSEWQKRGRKLAVKDDVSTRRPGGQGAGSSKEAGKPKKLSYKLKLELDALPAKIESLEARLAELQEQSSKPEFYAEGIDKVQPVLDEMTALQKELDDAMERWVELDSQPH